jgi:hypothetical protein
METVRTEILQAQGWEKWLSWIGFAWKDKLSALLIHGMNQLFA